VGAATGLRTDIDGATLRCLARKTKNANQNRRPLALAGINGGDRIAGVIATVRSKHPNTAFAQLGRIGGGESPLCRRAHPLSVLLSGKAGAVHVEKIPAYGSKRIILSLKAVNATGEIGNQAKRTARPEASGGDDRIRCSRRNLPIESIGNSQIQNLHQMSRPNSPDCPR
jgi:hypothetical protein